MDVLWRLAFRNLKIHRSNYIIKRGIMSTTPKLSKALEELEGNPYYKKYAEKISKLTKESPDEFLSRMEKHNELKQSKEKTKERQFTSLLQPKERLDRPTDPQEEVLDKIMKVDLIKDKTADEIAQIWKEYHMQKEVISATIPSEEYVVINEESKKYPIFLFAIPRSQGYEFIMSEFRGDTVHFTPLICYQVHKENSPECLTIRHYTEFKDDKGIVLMRGEYDKNVIDAKEAQCLANQLQMYYNKRDGEKSALLEQFTSQPDDFKHMDIIKNIENLSLR